MSIPYEDLVGYSAVKRRNQFIVGNVPKMGMAEHSLAEYSSLAAAKAAIGNSTVTTLTIAEPYTLAASVDFSDTKITLKFVNDGKITSNSSVILTVGAIECAANRQIFDVSAPGAKVLFSRAGYLLINIGWFHGTANGTDATKGIAQSLESCTNNDGGVIFFPEARYTSTGAHIVPKATHLFGAGDFITVGNGGTEIKLVSPTSTYLFKVGETTYDTSFAKFTLNGTGTTNKDGILFEGNAPNSSGKCVIEKITFSTFKNGINYNTLSSGTTWQMAQVGLAHVRFIGCTVGIRQTSVNSSWALENVNFYTTANGIGLHLVNGGNINMKSCEFAGNGNTNTKSIVIDGAHVNLNIFGGQEEGSTTFLENNASDISGITNIVGVLVQAKIQINASCVINSFGNNYLSKVFKFGGVGTLARISSIGDHVQERDVADGVTVVSPAQIYTNAADLLHFVTIQSPAAGDLITMQPQRFFKPAGFDGSPASPQVVFGHDSGVSEDKTLWFWGRCTSAGVPQYGYFGKHIWNTGWFEVNANQTGVNKGWKMNFPLLSETPEPMIIPVSDETTDLTTGTAKVTFRMPYAFTVLSVRASVTTAPTGSTLIVDINESGTSILSTKISIDSGEKTSQTGATASVISDTVLADDAEITFDIDQIGSGTPGKGLKVTLIGYRT